MVGREKEISDLLSLLKKPDIGLITLHGLGGTGKTRLAVEVGQVALDLFTDGVWFVALAPLNSPDHIITATAAALRFSFQGSQDQESQLFHFLNGKKLLLIFDNLEHLLPEGSTALESILQSAPGARLLVTSRQPINTPWEWVYPLQGLDFGYGASTSNGETPAAVQLFMQHLSRIAGPSAGEDRACATQICEIVGGLPLALLLAASWGRALDCEEIVQEIRRGIGFLRSQQKAFPERHSSMQAVFDYSWRLLSDHEQAVLRKLSLFRGGFDRNAALEVAGADLTLLAGFIDQSFVDRVSKNRYQIHELLRQYLHDRLVEAGEETLARDRHLLYYMHLAEQVELVGEFYATWIDRFTIEIHNLRTALDWSLESVQARNLIHGLQLMVASWRIWHHSSLVKEGHTYLTRLLATISEHDNPRLYAAGLNLAAQLGTKSHEFTQISTFANEAMRIGLELKDARLIGDAYLTQADEALRKGDFASSRRLTIDALEIYQEINHLLGIAYALDYLGDNELHTDNFAAAYANFEAGLELARKLKDPFLAILFIQDLVGLAMNDPQLGPQKARSWAEEGLNYARKVNEPRMVQSLLIDLGEVFRMEGQYEQALLAIEEVFQIVNHTLLQKDEVVWQLNLGFVHFRLGHYDRSEQIFLENLVLVTKLEDQNYGWFYCLLGLAGIAIINGRSHVAAKILGALESSKEKLLFWQSDKNEYEYITGLVKAQFPEKQFQQLIKEGESLSFTEAAKLFQSQDDKEEHPADTEPQRVTPLTKRELEILRLVAQGLSDAQVAERLVISPRTVNAHLTSIYNKLGVNSRSAATRYAVEHGLA